MDKITVMANRARAAFKASQDKAPREIVPVGSVTQSIVATSAGDTSVLVYRPHKTPETPVPVFVNIHGGGFVMGSADDDDVWSRKIVNAVECVVVNIDYHLAPEHKFPVALEECYDVVRWVYNNAAELNIDPARIAVGGHSAGGNLTAAICLLAKDRGEFPIRYQVLDYPPLDLSIDPYTRPSADTLLTPKSQEFFNTCFFNTAADALNPLVSPLLAPDLTGLPAALIITAEYDPLRQDGELYAERLAAAGCRVIYKMFPGCMHAFTHFGPQKAAEEAWSLIHSQLRIAFDLSTRECQ